jgi:hypothetical protein
MTPHEAAKIRSRLAAGKAPNASGARAEAPQILAGSEPSAPLKLSPEQEETAAKNRAIREAHRQAQADALREADTQNTETGEPLDELSDDELLDRETSGDDDEHTKPDSAGSDESGEPTGTAGSGSDEIRGESQSG